MPATRPSLFVLVGLGLVAGFFAALFGVGGGIIIVPLLMLALHYEPRLATGTSLAAIGLTAFFGVVAYVIVGRVEWAEAAMIGFPAVVGAVAGVWLQQRISSRTLTLLFAVFLVVIAGRLLVE